MASPSALHDIYTTFLASVRSVGTACTLASVGVYLHRRNFVFGDGKKTLALISQQVTIPLFLFTKVVFCNQDWSSEPCPDVTKNLKDVWVLLFWPAYVVGWGLLVGYVAAKLSGTRNKKAAMAACAFGNSTGLPITLLTVVHSNFPTTTELGSVDPTLFLSVYLLLYPVLQWGVGGYLLAPEDPKETNPSPSSPKRLSLSLRNVLNNDLMEHTYGRQRRGLSETDASLYISEIDLAGYHARAQAAEEALAATETEDASSVEEEAAVEKIIERQQSLPATLPSTRATLPVVTEETWLLEKEEKSAANGACDYRHFHSARETFMKILGRCLQPPVIGAVLGLFVAATPLRGIFVDIVDRSSDAPLQWFFDALYAVGQAAVPLNMMILGCNLSASHLKETNDESMSNRTMIAIVVGKMLVMPAIGILSALVLEQYIWDIPDSIDAAFYLVAMIVFITPTANNVMVMVELSGGADGKGEKEAMAQILGWQYALSPLLLSLTMSVVVGVASQWS